MRRECLDHLLIVESWHPRGVLAEFQTHDNDHRPHQARQQRPPNHSTEQIIDLTTRIRRTQVLGGLINEYHRVA